MSWINTLRTSAEDSGTLAKNNSSTLLGCEVALQETSAAIRVLLCCLEVLFSVAFLEIAVLGEAFFLFHGRCASVHHKNRRGPLGSSWCGDLGCLKLE